MSMMPSVVYEALAPAKAVRGTGADPEPDARPASPVRNPNPYLYQRRAPGTTSRWKDRDVGIKESPLEPAHPSRHDPDQEKRTFRAKTLGDLARYSPTRLRFTWPHPEPGKDRNDEFFLFLIISLYDRLNVFVTDHISTSPYGAPPAGKVTKESWAVWLKNRIPFATKDTVTSPDEAPADGRVTKRVLENFQKDSFAPGSPWKEVVLAPKFLELVEEIARADPDCGGWDMLFGQDDERRYTIMGVIAQILKVHIFDELLFGATARQKRMLADEDEEVLHKEGYIRKKHRSEKIRHFMEQNILPDNFWRAVDTLTYQLCSLLFPLFIWKRPDSDDVGAPLDPPLTATYQALYDIVALAGYTSVCMAWSTSIFRIEFATPGDLVNLDQEHYNESPYNRSKEAGEIVDDAPALDGNWNGITDAAGNAVSRRDGLPPRMAKVKIVMWPNIRRYKPLGKPQGEWIATDGDRISTIIKSRVVYYSGRTDDLSEQRERLTLKEYLKELRLHKDEEGYADYYQYDAMELDEVQDHDEEAVRQAEAIKARGGLGR